MAGLVVGRGEPTRMEHERQSRSDAGLVLQATVLKTFSVVPPSRRTWQAPGPRRTRRHSLTWPRSLPSQTSSPSDLDSCGKFCRVWWNWFPPFFSPSGQKLQVQEPFLHPPPAEGSELPVLKRLVLYCRTTSASTAPCTPRGMCCPTHCASYCALCQPLLRALSGWIRSLPPTMCW